MISCPWTDVTVTIMGPNGAIFIDEVGRIGGTAMPLSNEDINEALRVAHQFITNVREDWETS